MINNNKDNDHNGYSNNNNNKISVMPYGLTSEALAAGHIIVQLMHTV